MKSLIFFSAGDFERIPLSASLARYLFSVYLLGGGTLINRNETVLNACLSYSAMTRKSFIFGAGVANEQFWLQFEQRRDLRVQWKRYFDRCSFIGVRGPDSLDCMHEMGVDAEIIGDPVLALGRPSISPKKKEKRIGINFGFSNDRLWGGSDFRLWEYMVGFIQLLLDDGWTPSIFNVYDRDLVCVNSILRGKNWENIIPVANYCEGDISSALDYFDDIDIFVGEKLHASVFAAITFTPFCMIEYRPKCHDFMASIGMIDYNVKTNEAIPGLLMDKVKWIYDRIDPIQEELFLIISKYRNKLHESSKVVLSHLVSHAE